MRIHLAQRVQSLLWCLLHHFSGRRVRGCGSPSQWRWRCSAQVACPPQASRRAPPCEACKAGAHGHCLATVSERQTDLLLVLLARNVSRELDFRVEYNYSFLSELTLHSWEPNSAEKTEFRIVLPDMKSERLVYKICWKRAVLVFQLLCVGSPSSNSSENPMTGGGCSAPLPQQFQIRIVPSSFARLPENHLAPSSSFETRSTTGFSPRCLFGAAPEPGACGRVGPRLVFPSPVLFRALLLSFFCGGSEFSCPQYKVTKSHCASGDEGKTGPLFHVVESTASPADCFL